VGLDSLVRRTAAPYGFDLRLSEDGYGPSDNASFYKAKVPVLMFFTGAHADYHKPSDTWDKLDAGGIARIARLAYDLTVALDGGPQLAYRQAAPDSSYRRIGGGGGYGATLGTIPDFSQSEGGLRIADVRADGPGAVAGLRGGDVITAMDGVRIDNIYDFTYALRTRRPGQKVTVSVLRDGEPRRFEAVLGKRGESR
jgi:membrane-associated protease RseP (regulator of RpoE activity)